MKIIIFHLFIVGAETCLIGTGYAYDSSGGEGNCWLSRSNAPVVEFTLKVVRGLYLSIVL